MFDDDLKELFDDHRHANDALGDWTTTREVWTVSSIATAMSRVGRRVGLSTVRAWCETGVLTASKTSERGHYRIKASDLRTFLNGHPTPLSDAA